jgi:hypothetical protein
LRLRWMTPCLAYRPLVAGGRVAPAAVVFGLMRL